MSMLRERDLNRIIECGIVITVIRNDELIADMTKIFLPRESPTFFQRCTGIATRETSAMISAAEDET